MRRLRSLPRSGAIVLVSLGLLVAGASASGTLPASPTAVGVTRAPDGLQVEPARIIYTGDGSGLLAGADVGSLRSRIEWTEWTAKLARGTGFNQLDDCEPSCAGGRFHGYPVRIEQWRPRELGGALVFTRMTIFYGKSRPPGQPSHYTFTDVYSAPGGYGWGPPGVAGYCTDTQGLAPAAGCQNIHSLP